MKEFLYKIKQKVQRFSVFTSTISDFILYVNNYNNYKWARFVPDSIYLKCWYKKRTGEKLNLRTPESLNEKLQWLKINYRKAILTRIVDKYEVKKYISERIGDGYTVPTVGVWDCFDDINFDDLPDSFVLKCTHDSGSIVVCKDKADFDISAAKQKIESRLNQNYFWKKREWPYKDVKPRIICEAFLSNKAKTQLVDYKFYCFGGKPKYFMYSIGEAEHKAKNHKFDMELHSIDHLFKKTPALDLDEINLPENIDEMIGIVENLCKDFPHVRVDLYNIDGKIYVGEMTFFSNAGILIIESKGFSQSLADCINIDALKG